MKQARYETRLPEEGSSSASDKNAAISARPVDAELTYLKNGEAWIAYLPVWQAYRAIDTRRRRDDAKTGPCGPNYGLPISNWLERGLLRQTKAHSSRNGSPVECVVSRFHPRRHPVSPARSTARDAARRHSLRTCRRTEVCFMMLTDS